jgi:Peptidase family S41
MNMTPRFLVVLIGCFPGVGFAQKIDAAATRDDFQIFKSALVEAHPGLFRYETVATIDSVFTEVERSLTDSMTQQQFFQRLSPVIANIHCGHTKFHPENTYNEERLYHYFFQIDRLFPLKLYFSEEKVFVQAIFGENTDIEKGSELLTVNGQSIAELRDSLFRNLVADGRVESSKYAELNNYFPAYYANLIGSPDQFEVMLKLGDGSIIQYALNPVSLSVIRDYMATHSVNVERSFDITFPQNNTALMTIRAFYPTNKKDDFKQFLKASFREIKARNVEKLIIDLRDNEGGIDRWGAMLFAYLTDQPFRYYESLRLPNKHFSFGRYAQFPKFSGLLKLFVRKDTRGGYRWIKHKNLKRQRPQQEAFLGEVIVLINGGSFSVTSEFASVAKASGRVRLIGEETGGAYGGNNSGTFTFVTLPNSRLTVAIPMLGYYMDVPQIQSPERGVLPDLKVVPTMEDILQSRDVVLEKALHNN